MFIPSLLNLSGVVCLQTDRHESKRNKVKVNIQGKHLRRAICAPMFPCICVGNDLSSRLVAKQVFSAQQSLTSVFGMGTGGTSSQSTPTLRDVPSKLNNESKTKHILLGLSPRPISIYKLNCSHNLHFRPINLVVFKGS